LTLKIKLHFEISIKLAILPNVTYFKKKKFHLEKAINFTNNCMH
jgi:hypothetical protein